MQHFHDSFISSRMLLSASTGSWSVVLAGVKWVTRSGSDTEWCNKRWQREGRKSTVIISLCISTSRTPSACALCFVVSVIHSQSFHFLAWRLSAQRGRIRCLPALGFEQEVVRCGMNCALVVYAVKAVLFSVSLSAVRWLLDTVLSCELVQPTSSLLEWNQTVCFLFSNVV